MKDVIEFKKIYNHSIEDVWDAISTKEGLSSWLMPCDIEAKIGNEFTFQTKPYPGFDGTVHCKVKELDPPNKIAYTWKAGNLDTIVTFKLSSTQQGTILHFTQTGFKGLLNKLFAKQVLARGWKRTLLNIKLKKYLDDARRI
ncbi:MAG: SRPBCC domain-containing protein [Bacteroidota bacterium]